MTFENTVECASSRIAEFREQGSKIVFVSGNFNVIHPGHLRLLRFAKDSGDIVVVGVNAAGSEYVTVPVAMRLDAVQSISFVDYAFILDVPPEVAVERLRPDVVVKGKEYEQRANAEERAVEAYGGKLLFGSGEVRFSSIGLLQREYFETTFSTISKPKDYPERHAFSVDDLALVIDAMKPLRVTVIGDLIIDTYHNCDALGMSQEDPTIVVTPIEKRTFVGGAGVVAMHARGLGATVKFVSVVGVDENAEFARRAFAAKEIEAHLIEDTTRPTTHKQRYRASGKTLLRVNELRQHPIDRDRADKFLAAVERLLPQTDLLLFSDFNYGCLPQSLVDSIVARANETGVTMAADSQASSQLADISRFRGMTLITPTEREARLALRDFDSGIAVIAEKLQHVACAKHVVITLGAEGLVAYGPQCVTNVLDKLAAFNIAPKDVAGAGDSLFATTSMALCAGADIWKSVYLGSVAAGCQVSRVGNTPITLNELKTELDYP